MCGASPMLVHVPMVGVCQGKRSALAMVMASPQLPITLSFKE